MLSQSTKKFKVFNAEKSEYMRILVMFLWLKADRISRESPVLARI